MIALCALACPAKQRDVLDYLAMNAFERARKACSEKRVNDNVIAVRRYLFPSGQVYAFCERQGRRLCVRARFKAGKALRHLKVNAGVSLCVGNAPEEHYVGARAQQPKSACEGRAVAAIVAAPTENACALS
jgi:hypothetical protein